MRSKADYSLFYKGRGSTYVALLINVDNIVLTGASLKEINLFEDRLSVNFKLNDLDTLKRFLNLEIVRSQ